MTTTTTPSATATWANLLLSLGASLGSAFTTSPVIQNLIGVSATAAENLITTLTAAKSTGAPASSVAAPIFATVLQVAISVLETEGKLTADQSAVLSKAIADTFAADTLAQQIINPASLAPIAPLA